MGRRAIVGALVVSVLATACRAERLTPEDAEAIAASALAAVPVTEVPPGTGEVLGRWLDCSGQVADVDLDVLARAEDSERGALVVAHRGTASRRAARVGGDADTRACVREATGDGGFAAEDVDPPAGADVAARAAATVAGRPVALVFVAADEFALLAAAPATAGPAAGGPDVDAALEVLEEE
jgi:hypothetical protein